MKKQSFHHNHFFKNSAFLLSGILIGASMFLLTQASYTVQTNIDNAVQVIKRIVLQQSDGITTGSVLSGDMINTVHMQATEYCDEAGAHCKDVADILTGYTESDPVFLAHSGDYYTTGESDSRYLAGGGGESLWNTGSNYSINYMSGNVGIGTDTPSAKLEVNGDLKIRHNIISSDEGLLLEQHPTTIDFGDIDGTNKSLNFYANGDQKIAILTGGNVGIGTSTPDAKLDVYGETMILGNTTTKIISEIEDGRPKIRGIQNGTEKWLLGSYDTFGEKNLSLYTIDTGELHLGTNNQSRLTINGSGNVGIGTDTPQTKLQVNGMLMVAGYPDTINPCKSDGSTEGAIFYDTTHHYHCACDAAGTASTLQDTHTQCR